MHWTIIKFNDPSMIFCASLNLSEFSSARILIQSQAITLQIDSPFCYQVYHHLTFFLPQDVISLTLKAIIVLSALLLTSYLLFFGVNRL